MKSKQSFLVKYLAELGMARRMRRRGPYLVGVESSETIADHIFRAAQIAYILAVLEKADPEKSATLVLFCNNGLLRIGDQDKVAARYFDFKAAEKKAFAEQVKFLPERLRKKLEELFSEFKARRSQESMIAKDADWLATAVEAKEYLERGFKGQQEWLRNVRRALETAAAKDLLREIETTKDFTNSWWQGLQKMTYQKLKKR